MTDEDLSIMVWLTQRFGCRHRTTIAWLGLWYRECDARDAALMLKVQQNRDIDLVWYPARRPEKPDPIAVRAFRCDGTCAVLDFA